MPLETSCELPPPTSFKAREDLVKLRNQETEPRPSANFFDSISLDPSSPTWLGGKAGQGVRAGDREKTSQPLCNQSGAGLFLLHLLRGLGPHVESQRVWLQFPGLVLPRAPKGEPGRNLQIVNKIDSSV